MKLIKILIIFFVGVSPLWGYQSTEKFLKELDKFLDHKQMAKIIPNKKALEIGHLAETEDFEVSSQYLVSDELLRLLKRRNVLNTRFGELIEKFQAECDRLETSERGEAIAKWRSLWLEKVSSYLGYTKSLKRRWSFDITETLDYDSNVKLVDPDKDQFSGRRDTSLALNGNFKFRPFVNYKKSYAWKYHAQLIGNTKLQSSEKDLEYNSIGLKNAFSFSKLAPNLERVSFNHQYIRSYSNNPTNTRMEYGQHKINLNFQVYPLKFDDVYFSSAIHHVKLSFRQKEEFRDNKIGTLGEDVDAFSISIGQSLLKIGNKLPVQSYGWNLKYESQSVSPSSDRDYSFFSLGVNYSRPIPNWLPKYGLNWRTSASVRLKDWDSVKSGGNTKEDETQYTVSTSLSAKWFSNLSSNLSLSYLRKDQDLKVLTATDVASKGVDQWRIALSNTFLTF